MKRALCLLTICLLTTMAATAQRGLDFASKFMQMCQDDSTVQCVTVSPKMMEQLQLSAAQDESRNQRIGQAIAKLKSARIVTAAADAEADCYQRAEELLKRNKRRFQHERSFQSAAAHGEFYTRKDRNGDTVELVMLRNEPATGKTIIVNLTGDIDEEFISMLSL